jgi:hypothetical protein
MAHAGGRPPKLTEEQRAEVLEAFRLYIERTADATIVGFCAFDPVGAKYLITKDDINHYDEFSELRKYAIQKQEAYLITGAVTNKLNASMAIFRLKQPQHGYKDRIDTDITSGGEKLGANVSGEQLSQLARARTERADT